MRALVRVSWLAASVLFACTSRVPPANPHAATVVPTPTQDVPAAPPAARATDAGAVDVVESAPAEPPPEPTASGPSFLEKIDAFLRANLRVRARSGPRPERVTLRLRFDAQGNLLAAEIAEPSGVPVIDRDFADQLRRLVQRHARLDTLTPDEGEFLAERALRIVLPLDAIPH